jgi:hypothetical protein
MDGIIDKLKDIILPYTIIAYRHRKRYFIIHIIKKLADPLSDNDIEIFAVKAIKDAINVDAFQTHLKKVLGDLRCLRISCVTDAFGDDEYWWFWPDCLVEVYFVGKTEEELIEFAKSLPNKDVMRTIVTGKTEEEVFKKADHFKFKTKKMGLKTPSLLK